MTRRLISVALTTVLAAAMALAEETRARKETDETIAYLLDVVARCDCVFIRNGQSYSGKQASVHLKSKYQYFKAKIASPEDFIRLAATKSVLSGEPYMVRTKEGKDLRCDEWMKQLLEEYRRGRKDKEEKKKGG